MASNLGIDGLASGIDTSALIEKLMSLEKKPLTQAQTKKTDLEARSNAWRDVNSRLYNLQTKMAKLKSVATFQSRRVTLGQEDYFTATAKTSAAASSYQVEVMRLAKAHTVSSADITSSTTSLGYSGTFKINDKEVAITNTDTLSSIADKINSTKDVGVYASVVKMADNQFKLTLTSLKTGEANAISVSDDGDVLKNLGLINDTGEFSNVIQNGQDAQIKVNGLTINRASNTIDDVITGVTLNLKKEGATSMAIDVDQDAIVKAVKEFVDQYNSTMSFIQDSIKYDTETKKKGALFGETTLIYLQSEIRGYLSKTVSGVDKSVNQLALVGVSTGSYNSGIENAKSGTLVLDESKLRKALDEHFDDVMKLFGAKIDNVAASASGATVSVSSQFGPQFPAASLIDGRTGSQDWANGGGWNDNTPGEYPDIVEISFNGLKTVNSINLFTLDSETYPASTYGVSDVTLEYWDSASNSWKRLKQANDTTKDVEIKDNKRGVIAVDFNPVNTDKIRVSVTKTNGANDYTRLTEIQVMEKNNGIFSNFFDKINSLTRSGGIISAKRDSISDEQKALDKRIEYLNDQLERREAAYRAKFTAMETALSKLQQQSTALGNQLSQLASWSSNSKN